MPYDMEMRELAKGALAAHGRLLEVAFLGGNNDSLLVFDDGAVVPVLHSRYGYNIGREAWVIELARRHSGTDYLSLLTFGYSGTGSACYAAFLSTAGFANPYVDKISAPLKLKRDGTTVKGNNNNGSVKWADGSATPVPK